MLLTDEALSAYYEIRALAEQRHDAIPRPPQERDALRDDIEQRSAQLYRERLGNLENLDVAEVGVGSGDFAQHALAQRVRSLVLIDISRERLAALGKEFSSATLIRASADRMEGLPDGQLDLLVAKEVIEHLRDYRPFLAECRRVLRPGGRLYLTTPNRHAIDLWPRLALAKIVPPPKRHGDALIRQIFGHLYEHLQPQEAAHLAQVLPPGFKEHIHEFAPGELLAALRTYDLGPERIWGTPPHLFYHELRPLAKRLLDPWMRAERLSYRLGDDLRIIAVRR